MDITKSSNPVFGKNIFNQSATSTSEGVMTVNGTINKTGLMLLIVVFAATFTWRKFFGAIDPATPGVLPPGILIWTMVGAIGGLITALITTFSPRRAAMTAPIYAVFQGLFLGAVSAMFEAMYPGLVMRAVSLTFGVFFIMLFTARFCVEFIKEDQEAFEATMSLNMGQWLSIPFILTGIVLVVLSFRRGPVYYKNQAVPGKK